MKNLEIRPLLPADRDGMVELLTMRDAATLASAEQRWTLLEWMAFNNPSAGDRPTYYVAVYKGKIVAHLGRMPADFSYRGKDVQGYFIHDLFVHPDTRKMGLGFFISMGLYDR
ncbi:MAG: GNAT family N-acetyltransferase, partial [Ignavibacteria bacterium]|nr:GNAT family N-acetyltransferase [Ignavibacteria bacterium]